MSTSTRIAPPSSIVAPTSSTFSRSRRTHTPTRRPSSPALPPALFLHPHSAVFDRDAAALPEFLVFSEIVASARSYMRGATAADAGWLAAAGGGTPLLRFEAPLASPPPFYQVTDAAAGGFDRAVCYRAPLVGERRWRLTPILTPLALGDADGGGGGGGGDGGWAAGDAATVPADASRRLFARALLEGGVAPLLKPFAAQLAAPAASLARRAQPSARAALLLAALEADGVDSAASLARLWRARPAALRPEVQAWLPPPLHPVLAAAWRRIVDDFLARR